MIETTKDKFTPGPWEARIFHGMDGFGIYAAGKEHTITSANLYEHTTFSSAFERGEVEANGRLIAAAPDLMEALKDLQIRFTEMFNRRERPTYCTFHDANCDLILALATSTDAIKKATSCK